MTEIQGQMSIFDFLDQDIWSGKMSAEPSVPTTEKTSEPSLKKRQKWQKGMPAFLDLRGNGLTADASWEMGGALLGEYTMHSFGESPSVENVSLLSQILEENPHPKYSLSEKACQGILNRANRRGKKLPEILEQALIRQATPSKLGGGVEVDSKGKKAGKGPLIQTELSATLGVSQDQTLITGCFNPRDVQSKHIQTENMQKVYGISSYASNAMLSDNPNSGIYEAETARTLDLNGGSPACNQGGMAVVCIDLGAGKSAVNISKEQAPTLATTHGGEPAVCYEKRGEPTTASKASFFTQAHSDGTASTLVATDYKDPPIVCYDVKPVVVGEGGVSQTVGALCARDYKGVETQYVEEGKLIIEHIRSGNGD